MTDLEKQYPMQHFISALQFLTILPLGKPRRFVPTQIIPYFPLVGLAIGGLLCLTDFCANLLWPRPVASLVDLVMLAAVTGAFHLDGLGDTADGLFSHRGRKEALRIMKDSRVGAMGLIAVVCVLAIKWGGLAGMGKERWLFLLVVPALSRGAMIFGIRFLPYGRPGGGTGTGFFAAPLPAAAFGWLLLPLLMCLLAGLRGVAVAGAFFLLTALFLRLYRRQLGVITGDMLGAMTEVMEAVLFLVAAAGGMP